VTDPDFLTECGIKVDTLWLLDMAAVTPEQQRYFEDLQRIFSMLGQSNIGLLGGGTVPEA
jgi:hypothetical protein